LPAITCTGKRLTDNSKDTMNKQQAADHTPSQCWHVYIVRCSDKTYYTGITTDLSRRIEEHNSCRKGAQYTRSRRPVQLVYFEYAPSRSIAAGREYQIKKLTAAGKRQLIQKSLRLPGEDSCLQLSNSLP